MEKWMGRLTRQFKYGQKGFTLIELLVAIAILGILIAVVVPNVTNYLTSGKLTAANNEASMVQAGALAYIADGGTITDGATVGPAGSLDLSNYMQGNVVGTYTLNSSGAITAAASYSDTGFTWASDTAQTPKWFKP